MNISSIIINLNNENFCAGVLKKISRLKECEIVANQKDKIVVVISSDTLDKQLAIFKFIESFKEVKDISMIYSYEDLDEEISNLKSSNSLNDFLNDDSIDAKDICYSGSIHHKTK